MKLTVLAAASLLSLAACAPTDMAGSSVSMATETVEINAAYRERIALTPGHVLRVSVQDVSLADAPAKTLNEVSLPLDGRSPPYRVHVTVPSSAIQPNHRYAARAEIRDSAGNLRFTTDTHHGVLTLGQSNAATIIMIGVK
ncbi:hypothetical protein OB03_08305 [Brevundimonas sp. GN22]|uniref:YbaY family lipoprotein n=1 Tax=Brevundimonas pishanensis TaxID=2896315 RepID=UPI001FA7A1F2|nr:YbaY family lipoprotein [Brevundimonas pishanensis]